MLAVSNQVESKSAAEHSTEPAVGTQLMFHVSLVATATTSPTVGSCEPRVAAGMPRNARTTRVVAARDARKVPGIRTVCSVSALAQERLRPVV